MEITDYILVNMLKTQLVDMYRTYTDNPSLIDNTPSRWGYDLLVKANTVDDFKHWLCRASISDFSYTNVDGIKSRVNLLAEFVDLAMEANEPTIVEFVEWKNNVTPETVEQTDEINARNITKVSAALKGNRDVHAVICACGRHWCALGADAERLFEIFGWQPGYVLGDDCCHVPFMYITKYGIEVLKRSPYVVEIMDFPDSEIVSESFLEDETACAQQTLDFLRVVQDDIAGMSGFVKKDFPILARHGTHPRLLSVLNMHIKGRKITTRLDTGENIALADGSGWRLDEIGLPIICGLGKRLEEK